MRKVVGSSFDALRNRVVREAKRDLEFGFLLAEFDFEWLLRRMIICFSTCPTVVIRSLLKSCSGFDRYMDAWERCVKPFRPACPSLSDILKIPSKNQIKKGPIAKAFLKRHFLVHGARNCIGSVSALMGIDVMLESSSLLADFAEKNNVSLFKRISSRQHKCAFCSVKGRRVSKDALTICVRGVNGECPFLKCDELTQRIRKGIREQKMARKGSGIILSYESIRDLAKKYELLGDSQIRKVFETVLDRQAKGDYRK